jgi:flagellar biosynthesis/type III secretory pathway chaperone
MTIDERLEKLTERHEALTQTVQVIADMQRKNEVLMAQALEAINSLARIAQAHEHRIDRLEGRQ